MLPLNSCIGFGGSGGGAGSFAADIACISQSSIQNFGGQGGQTNKPGENSQQSPYQSTEDFQNKTAIFLNNPLHFSQIGDINKQGEGGVNTANSDVDLKHYTGGGGGGGMSSSGGNSGPGSAQQGYIGGGGGGGGVGS